MFLLHQESADREVPIPGRSVQGRPALGLVRNVGVVILMFVVIAIAVIVVVVVVVVIAIVVIVVIVVVTFITCTDFFFFFYFFGLDHFQEKLAHNEVTVSGREMQGRQALER